MFYLVLTVKFILKMLYIWGLPLMFILLSIIAITWLKNDSTWLKRVMRNTYRLMEGKN